MSCYLYPCITSQGTQFLDANGACAALLNTTNGSAPKWANEKDNANATVVTGVAFKVQQAPDAHKIALWWLSRLGLALQWVDRCPVQSTCCVGSLKSISCKLQFCKPFVFIFIQNDGGWHSRLVFPCDSREANTSAAHWRGRRMSIDCGKVFLSPTDCHSVRLEKER